jgi:hypothetical protein
MKGQNKGQCRVFDIVVQHVWTRGFIARYQYLPTDGFLLDQVTGRAKWTWNLYTSVSLTITMSTNISAHIAYIFLKSQVAQIDSLAFSIRADCCRIP